MLLTLACLPFVLPASFQEAEIAPAFPPTTPIEVGLSPQALEGLDELVASFVEDGEIVGGELLVIKDGKTVLHITHGWSDREDKRPLVPGSLFCVRSMTKPLIGTSIMMLADDKALDLDDPVSKFLPVLDNDTWRNVTIEQMLTHTSGLPYSLLIGKGLNSFKSIQEVAALTADYTPDFEPGTNVAYSDQGTDTLAAVVEVASGMPVEDFVRTRILDPLGMSDSRCLLPEDEPLRARSASKYMGSRGAWTRYWSPADPPIFPCFLGSQGLYSTTVDYAKFLAFWMNKGRVGRERVMSARRVRKALTPGPHRLIQGTGFPDLRTEYGCLMALHMREQEDGKDELVSFGHAGSDGTHAWAFPEEDALVMYFTQSRGNTTGLRVEEALGGLLLGGAYDPNVEAPPLEQYLGFYWEGEDDLYRAIVVEGSGLGLEVLGKTVLPLQYVGNDTWRVQANPATRLEFQRAEDGRISGYRTGDHEEFRFEPSPDLPAMDDVVERVLAAHQLARLSEVGPIRLRGTVDMPQVGMTGTFELLLADGGRFRSEYLMGEQYEKIAFDGERVWYASTAEEPSVVEGTRAETLKNDSLGSYFGDWRKTHTKVEVVQSLSPKESERALLVRLTPKEGYAQTVYIHEETGRIGRLDNISVMPGIGVAGTRTQFGDYREVAGMTLPYRMVTEFATPLLGTMTMLIEDVELEVELGEGAFEIRE